MSIGTPCPAPSVSSSLPLAVPSRRLSTTSTGSTQEDTAEIDYTRAIQVEFKNAKPRRRSTFQKREKKDAAVTIFEDVLEDEELVVDDRRETGGSTLLGKPAQKIPSHAMTKKQDAEPQGQPLQVVGQALKSMSMAAQPTIPERGPPPRVETREAESAPQLAHKVKGDLKREPRRRTIFVPTDDTTMMTIHPGANTTDRLNDTFQFLHLAVQPPAVKKETRVDQPLEAPQPGKKSRMSLSAAPKRLPLQQVASKDNNGISVDMAGQNGGKENLPPSGVLNADERKPTHVSKPPRRVSIAHSRLFEPTVASQARNSVVVRSAAPLPEIPGKVREQKPVKPRVSVAAQKFQPEARPRLSLRPSPPRTGPQARSVERASNGKRICPEQARPIERRIETKNARLQQYPFLSEDLAQPELYEDSWLGHQEVALTELINHLFSSVETKTHQYQNSNVSLRESLIDIYHRPHVTTLHKRLQASLLYGALSRPRDTFNPPNPAQDIGLRKRFLGFWLDSYDAEFLQAAAEVVFGRKLRSRFNNTTGITDGTLDPYKNRRALIGFLETFVIEVDDVEDPDEERGDDSYARWRKTVLRSLMLIWLLDQAKASKVVQRCLFKSGSPRKSSVAMLHGLASLLIPSIGDITRALRYLDYDVSHVQDPLDEMRYRIDNIAVDLRDGILLTRLVELLLFSPTRMRIADKTGDATVTIQMPDLTILESALHGVEEAHCPRILSQHLKMPCLGRAQRAFNVQVAISALHDHGRGGVGASDITVDDVVDGHREKTLSLLWSLVSNYGLEELVDFKQLRVDIKRIGCGAVDTQTLDEDNEYLSRLQQESLLKKWASVYCGQKGIRISNLTTSFADGKAYAAILDAFAEYINTKGMSSTSPVGGSRLEVQLHAFGCSSAFIKQLTSTCGTIPSRKTTISNLAFLASRLLPLARQYNAAITIQRAFRLKRSRTLASQRIALMRLAHACATVVQTQNRLVSAATMLQRAWRRVLDSRIKRLNSDVEGLQAIAKRWVVRRRVQRQMSRGMSDSQSLRVMGGW